MMKTKTKLSMNRLLGAGVAAGLALTLAAIAQDEPTTPTTRPTTQPMTDDANANQTVTTPEGVKYVITKGVTEPKVAEDGDVLMVHYTGMLEDGTVFDTSRQIRPNTRARFHEPIMLELGRRQVILGWEIGLRGMKVGEQRRLTIPSDLAYGDEGRGPIPPKATLIFDVELVGLAREADAR